MVVNDFDVVRPCRAVGPFETNPPLVVDADAVLALAIVFEGLETVSRQGSEVADGGCRFEAVEFQAGGPLNAGEVSYAPASGKSSSAFIPETQDHRMIVGINTRYVKRNGKNGVHELLQLSGI